MKRNRCCDNDGLFLVWWQRRNDGGVMNRRTSRFYLVDLAGSERQKHSESAGIRLKEAGSINKSLSALGNVIKVRSYDQPLGYYYKLWVFSIGILYK